MVVLRFSTKVFDKHNKQRGARSYSTKGGNVKMAPINQSLPSFDTNFSSFNFDVCYIACRCTFRVNLVGVNACIKQIKVVEIVYQDKNHIMECMRTLVEYSS